MISQIFINTSLKKNNQIILSTLFLIYFVVYAISPLSYNFDVKKIVGRIGSTNGMSPSLNNLNIFFLEELCSKIDPKKEIDHSSSTVRVLIRKTRAILPEDANSKLAPTGNLAILEYISSLSDNFLSKRLVFLKQQAYSFHFNPLHSCHSPPVA